MSAKEIKGLAGRWFEEANKGKATFMAVVDELHTTDIVGSRWRRRGNTRT